MQGSIRHAMFGCKKRVRKTPDWLYLQSTQCWASVLLWLPMALPYCFPQVRHMAGALLAVGSGRLEPEAISQNLELGSKSPPGRGGVSRGWKVVEAKVRVW